ncbi:hypothetical protein F4780DRAFT_84230 [Xylariomycetidae sp. FL0641]|nr:hypothetical protein F4780DRAFT_84230 [Xylariomycetidae sp. FL0641]
MYCNMYKVCGGGSCDHLIDYGAYFRSPSRPQGDRSMLLPTLLRRPSKSMPRGNIHITRFAKRGEVGPSCSRRGYDTPPPRSGAADGRFGVPVFRYATTKSSTTLQDTEHAKGRLPKRRRLQYAAYLATQNAAPSRPIWASKRQDSKAGCAYLHIKSPMRCSFFGQLCCRGLQTATVEGARERMMGRECPAGCKLEERRRAPRIQGL